MSKKQKRQGARPITTPTSQSTAAAPASGTSSFRSSLTTEFNPDYTYVKQDLKRIGILASSFVIILVVISFFIH
jgi:hypothetical protein